MAFCQPGAKTFMRLSNEASGLEEAASFSILCRIPTLCVLGHLIGLQNLFYDMHFRGSDDCFLKMFF